MNWIFVESCTKTVLKALPVTLELTVISFVFTKNKDGASNDKNRESS